MNILWNFLRPIISRVIGAWVGGLAIWLSAKYGVVLDENTQLQIIAGAVALLYAIGQTVNAVVHRTLDKKLNPGDAASNHLADVEAKEVHVLKAKEALRG